MWKAKYPEKDGFYWFKGEVKNYDGSWKEVDEVVVKIIRPLTYFPGSDSGVSFSEITGLWKEVDEKAYTKTIEALDIAESLLEVSFDEFTEATGFMITSIELLTHTTNDKIDKVKIANISFGMGSIHINKKE